MKTQYATNAQFADSLSFTNPFFQEMIQQCQRRMRIQETHDSGSRHFLQIK